MTSNRPDRQKQVKKAVLKPSDPIPEDIHWEWLEVAKAAQAACKDNNGFAKLTLIISVQRNKPILWSVQDVTEIKAMNVELPKYNILQLSPKRIAEYKMSAETIAALLAAND